MDGHEAAGVERDDEAAAPGPNGSEFSNWAEFDSGRHPISPEAGFSTQSTPEGGERMRGRTAVSTELHGKSLNF